MDCDPILAAGYRYCTPCRAETYPDDAAWVGDDLILASYPPLCRHDPHARVQLIVPSALGVAAARCAGLTASGARCRNRPADDSAHCWQHDPARRPG